MVHEFYSCGLSCLRQLVRVASHGTRHIDSASQWNRLSDTGSWCRFHHHDRWTPSSLLCSFVPAHQHVSILRSPFLIVELAAYVSCSRYSVSVSHIKHHRPIIILSSDLPSQQQQLPLRPSGISLSLPSQLTTTDEGVMPTVSGNRNKTLRGHVQTGGQTTTSGTVLPQLPINHHESHVTAAQRPQPAASNGISLPRLSVGRKPGRALGCRSLQTAATAEKKGRLTRRDKENNAINTAPDLVPMPLSPEDVLTLYSSRLSPYETDEIQNYRQIWFLGLESEKVKAITGASLNNGFDDQHGSYIKENILVKPQNETEIKVIDFGSSCYEHQRVYTYIQSRFYRAPEVILGLPYTTAIDMWSLGCIVAELHTGYPLFPGENEVEQLACIMEVFGPPPSQMVESATRRKLFFDAKGSPRCTTNSKGRQRHPGSRDLARAVRSNDPLFLDFIRKCLVWDAAERMTPEEAAHHEWLSEIKHQCPKIVNHFRRSPVKLKSTGEEINDNDCDERKTCTSRSASPLNGNLADTNSPDELDNVFLPPI